MDKVEYKIRADEIKALIGEGRFAEAVNIADTIDWKRVKSVSMLCTISDLYKLNRRFQESKDILLMAYDRHPTGRLIVYSLCELSIKMGEFVQAVEYYKEFVRIAPRDTSRYILQYKLYEAQEVSLEERIAVLEEFKKHDYRERWAYELAYLYHRVGLTTECIEECDEIFLWFGDGRYVMKALELKALHEPLSPQQQDRYVRYKQSHGGVFDASIVNEKDEVGKDETRTVEIKQPTKEMPRVTDKMIEDYNSGRTYEQEEEAERTREFVPGDIEKAVALTRDKQPVSETKTDANVQQTRDYDEIVYPHISEIKAPAFDVSKYNTLNLQESLKESLKEVIGDDTKDMNTASLETREIAPEGLAPITEEIFEDTEAVVPENTGTETFFDQTSDFKELRPEYDDYPSDNTDAYDDIDDDHSKEVTAKIPLEGIKNKSVDEVFFDTSPRMGIEIKYSEKGPILGEEKKVARDERKHQDKEEYLSDDLPLEEENIPEEEFFEEDDLPLEEEDIPEEEYYEEDEPSASPDAVPRKDYYKDEEAFDDENDIPEEEYYEEEYLPEENPPQNNKPIRAAQDENLSRKEYYEEDEYLPDDESADRVEIAEDESVDTGRMADDEPVDTGEIDEDEPVYEKPSKKSLLEDEVPGAVIHPNSNYQMHNHFESMLTQESDGQITLAVEPEPEVEKQITGQISIAEYLENWEKYKRDQQQKQLESVKQRVADETGDMFADFEEKTREGLQERIEKAINNAIKKEREEKYSGRGDWSVTREDVINAAIESAVNAPSKDEEEEAHQPIEAETKTQVTNVEASEEGAEDNEKLQEKAVDQVSASKTAQDENSGTSTGNTGNESVSNDGGADKAQASSESRKAPKTESENKDISKKSEEKKKAQHIGNREIEERVRSMTPEEKELFGPYIHHKKSRRQIINAIDNLSMDAYSGNAIVTGEEGAGTVNLAKGLIKAMQAQDANFNGKVAKITANTLNKKSTSGIFDKLTNGALIIQRAADLDDDTVSEVLKILQNENKGLVLVMEDTREDMDRFLERNPALKQSFNVRVDIEALDDDSLVAYARQYALEKEFAIDNLGILALHTRISERQTLDHDVTVSEVKDIVDDAIYFATKRNLGHFVDLLVNKRYDENDMIILREKDFMHD
ncbi:MAG: hypothetical protein K6E91_13700 [Butyrivibrio sp.]|nr:hypothetical protein [Butyrivibrio sp.]